MIYSSELNKTINAHLYVQQRQPVYKSFLFFLSKSALCSYTGKYCSSPSLRKVVYSNNNPGEDFELGWFVLTVCFPESCTNWLILFSTAAKMLSCGKISLMRTRFKSIFKNFFTSNLTEFYLKGIVESFDYLKSFKIMVNI